MRVLVPQEVVKTVCEPIANKRNPANSYDAQFSIPYIVATGLLKGRFTLAELEDEALRDSAVLSLASRVDYEVDPALDLPAALHRRSHRRDRGRTQPASPRGDQSRLRRSAAEQRRGGGQVPRQRRTRRLARHGGTRRRSGPQPRSQNAARARRRAVRRALRRKQWTPSPTRLETAENEQLVLDMVDKFLGDGGAAARPRARARRRLPGGHRRKDEGDGIVRLRHRRRVRRPRPVDLAPTRRSSSGSRRCGCRSAASSTRT